MIREARKIIPPSAACVEMMPFRKLTYILYGFGKLAPKIICELPRNL